MRRPAATRLALALTPTLFLHPLRMASALAFGLAAWVVGVIVLRKLGVFAPTPTVTFARAFLISAAVAVSAFLLLAAIALPLARRLGRTWLKGRERAQPG